MKRIVLCRPSGPRNVGAIVRAVANFGPAELTLVAPQRKALLVHPEFEQMSHGVEDLVARCRVVGTLAEALEECHDSVGFTARGRDHREIREWSTRVEELRAWGSDPERRLALVFGAEVNGLSNEEADLCRELVHIETGNEHTSLNLSVAVALVLHGLFRPTAAAKRDKATRPLEGKDLEYLIANLRHVFVEAAWTESAKHDIALSVERVLRRATVEHRDARAWHMALRALGSTKTPNDFGIS